MITILKKLNTDFEQRPRFYLAISLALVLFVILAITLSLVCPPAALAVGIGAWSLIGNILPLASLGLSVVFFATIMTARMASHVSDIIDFKKNYNPSDKLTKISKDLDNPETQIQASPTITNSSTFDQVEPDKTEPDQSSPTPFFKEKQETRTIQPVPTSSCVAGDQENSAKTVSYS